MYGDDERRNFHIIVRELWHWNEEDELQKLVLGKWRVKRGKKNCEHSTPHRKLEHQRIEKILRAAWRSYVHLYSPNVTFLLLLPPVSSF